MYIVVGTPHVYRVQSPPSFRGYEQAKGLRNGVDIDSYYRIIGVNPNRERNLFMLWSSSSFYLWNCRPAVQIFAHSRSIESVAEYGQNCRIIWKSDSSSIAVAFEHSNGGFFTGWTGSKRFEKTSYGEDFLPWTSVVALQISPSYIVKTDGLVSDFCSIRDEILVSLSNGTVQRISWSEGLVNFAFSFNINNVPFGHELQHFRGVPLNPNAQNDITRIYVKSIVYSHFLAGFVMSLSDGRAGFITSPTLKFEPAKLQAVWAREVQDATGCQSVNNHYRLLCFGLASGRVAIYCIGELTGSLDLVQRMEISPADCPDAHARCGSVSAMVWSPDERILAVAWQNEGLAVYSVFGSLLFFSLTSLPMYCAPVMTLLGNSPDHRENFFQVEALDWSPEGYQLWIVAKQGYSRFVTMNYAKSALTRNSCESNHLHVLMQSDECLYVGLVDRLYTPFWSAQANELNPPQSATSQVTTGNGDSGPAMALSVVPIAPGMAYLVDNWPIVYSCISETGDWLAVAGRTGLACFSLKRRQWKLFGNVSQERDFAVSGGLILWRDFVAAICYNITTKHEELRFYPLAGRLDNANATTYRLETQALLLNCFHDSLIVFGIDSVVTVYHLRKRNQTVERHKLVELNIGQFLAHPLTVTHVTLTTLSTDLVLMRAGKADSKSPKIPLNNSANANSLLVTASGRVLLLQADRPISGENPTSQNVIFSTPVRIAENVEHLWLMACDPINNAALAETIWLYCGRNGANVWLPLVNTSSKNTVDPRSQAFLSKRVMLQVDCPIYPLTALLSVAAVVGATSETTASAFLPFSSTNKNETRVARFEALRSSHSYLPSILRQLLRRHLGLQALEVTRSWSHLPNFPHVLELLLHQVVDEEALSKEPLPDPLLPRVVAFIQEFPEHAPAVVVQCARKMEAILWPYLFATVGPPRDLFADCLRRQDLNTAVSYLIILHTTEQSSLVSRQLTSEFLTAVLDKKRWALAHDILRFLRSIGSACLDPPPVQLQSPKASKSESILNTQVPLTPQNSNQWSTRANSDSAPSQVTPPPPTPSNSLSEDPPIDIDIIEKVVYPYLRKLVYDRRLLDLGRLAAAVHGATRGFSLAAWLCNERLKDLDSFQLADFVATLHRLHSEFELPYPVLVHASPVTGSHSYASLRQPDSLHSSPSQALKLAQLRMAPSQDNFMGSGGDIELVPKFTLGNGNNKDYNMVSNVNDNNSDSGSIISRTESIHSLMSTDNAVAVPPPNHVQVLKRSGMAYRHEEHIRFLFKIMIEASWYDWALLLSIILRDARLGVEAVRAIVALMSHDEASSNGSSTKQQDSQGVDSTAGISPAIVSTVRDVCIGFGQFVSWAAQDCPGYLAFAHVMDPQIRRLSALLAQSPPASAPQSRSESPKPVIPTLNQQKIKAESVSIPSESLPTSPVPPTEEAAASPSPHFAENFYNKTGASRFTPESSFGDGVVLGGSHSTLESLPPLNAEDHLIAADHDVRSPSNCVIQ